MPIVPTLAATFTIVFEGLVAFIGPEDTLKTHAVIVEEKENGHEEPQLIVNGEAFELQKGDQVTFAINGQTSGVAATTTSFDTRVPTLKDQLATSGGDLKKGVKEKNPKSDGVVAIVALPDGKLHAQGAFDYPIRFEIAEDTWTEPLCAARQVRFESGVLPDSTIVKVILQKASGERIDREVSANADVHITNTSNRDGLHYHGYDNLLAGTRTRNVLEVTGQRCRQSGDGATSGRASNAPAGQLKEYAPRSDCGPTDWP